MYTLSILVPDNDGRPILFGKKFTRRALKRYIHRHARGLALRYGMVVIEGNDKVRRVYEPQFIKCKPMSGRISTVTTKKIFRLW